jgi:hypothetical protein
MSEFSYLPWVPKGASTHSHINRAQINNKDKVITALNPVYREVLDMPGNSTYLAPKQSFVHIRPCLLKWDRFS